MKPTIIFLLNSVFILLYWLPYQCKKSQLALLFSHRWVLERKEMDSYISQEYFCESECNDFDRDSNSARRSLTITPPGHFKTHTHKIWRVIGAE